MSYFKILGLVFGLATFLKPFYMHILPWDENAFIEKAYSEKRPGWIIWVSIIGFLLVSFTWYKYFITDVPYSIIITLLFSLTLIKGMVFVFNYKAFFLWVSKMLSSNDGKKIVAIDIGVGVFGLMVIILSVLLY